MYNHCTTTKRCWMLLGSDMFRGAFFDVRTVAKPKPLTAAGEPDVPVAWQQLGRFGLTPGAFLDRGIGGIFLFLGEGSILLICVCYHPHPRLDHAKLVGS